MFNPLNLITKFIKSSNQKELDRIGKIVEKINSYEEQFIKLGDTDFPKKTIEFIETGPGMTAEALHKASEKGVRYTSFEDPLVMDG